MTRPTQYVGRWGAAAPWPGKLTVWSLATGEALQRWSVDAKELVASGEYAWTPPAPHPSPLAEPSPAVADEPALSALSALHEAVAPKHSPRARRAKAE